MRCSQLLIYGAPKGNVLMDIVIIDKIEMMTLVMTSQVMMTVMLLISLTPGPQPIRGLHGD